MKKGILIEDVVWIVLVLLTILSYEFVDGLHEWAYLSVAVIIIAMFKIRLVVMHFMEIKHAPLPLRLVLECWMLVVGGGVLYFQLI